MKPRSETINIFLPDGNPRGVRIADMLSRTVKSILFPRNQFEFVLSRSELYNVGFYFLFGKDKDGKDMVYIGEAENCADRLKSHQHNKDFWNYAVVIISKDLSLTKTHIKYLEHYSIQEAKEAARYVLENVADPKKPYITESMEAEMLACFDTTKILISALGFPLFDSISKQVVLESQKETFIIKGKDIQADGSLIDEGFVVFKGSTAKITTAPSCHKYLIDLRKLLLETKVIIPDGEVYRFIEDYIFSSPSTAGGVILGRSTNGWVEWKNSSNKTLDEVKRNLK